MLGKRLREFMRCHQGKVNLLLHVVGYSLVGVGIWQKSFWYVIAGAIVQELGHFYQYVKTKNYKDSPLYCLRSQVLFALPALSLILIYIWIAR
ncbi:hypothetical protein HYX70_00665 [Candidatus Saccharibacteria bacterium]|nr:hypothetical protein [Candidatus Saccharibacteria bacterium]